MVYSKRHPKCDWCCTQKWCRFKWNYEYHWYTAVAESGEEYRIYCWTWNGKFNCQCYVKENITFTHRYKFINHHSVNSAHWRIFRDETMRKDSNLVIYTTLSTFSSLCSQIKIPNNLIILRRSFNWRTHLARKISIANLWMIIIFRRFYIDFVFIYSQTGQRIVEDVMKIRWEIISNLLFAMFSCLIVIAMMRFVAKPLVWLSILGVLAMLGFGKENSAQKIAPNRNLRNNF